ncbi:MAG: hypothetical protein IT303_07485 [Dehalococcoidia bacterium]|nr:hypothetical protein [Dehalococcoidia bacterium]
MGPVDIRRLAAIDMYGSGGSPVRRWIIVLEFVLGATVGTGIGLLVALSADSLGWQIFGAFIAGACLNYVPLSIHALSLLRGGALSEELAGVDTNAELWKYTRLQFWIAVPLLFVLLAFVQLGRHQPGAGAVRS